MTLAIKQHLLVDIGNTRIKWVMFLGKKFPGEPLSALIHRGKTLSCDQLSAVWAGLPVPDAVSITSVADAQLNQMVLSWIKANWNLTPFFLDKVPQATDLIPVYADSGKFGVDRWLAMLALRAEYSLPAVVVNCGSAITLDVLDERARHQGGLILPGIQLMSHSLVSNLSKVESVDSKGQEDSAFLGQSTQQCISRASLLAASGMIEKVMDVFQKKFNLPITLVFSGGDARLIQSETKQQGISDPYLVLKGLSLL